MFSSLPPLSPELWDLWQDQAHSPAFNMAADETLLETAAQRGRPLLRYYAWDCLAVSIGYIQRYNAAPEGFAVVRRPTGGGVVYHDHDFTYTLVFPQGHWLTELDRNQSYDHINRCILQALGSMQLATRLADNDISSEVDRQAMVCFTNPTRYDILLDERKVAGSAQRRNQYGILHQGSLHFGGPLPVARETLATAIQDAFTNMLNISFQTFRPDPELLQKINLLAREKYNCPEWNQRR
ncbi:MAG: lipoate--protein ligase family protein [Oligosphaeraceae bacterium]|nr:lipoate--protein ligase family protein [Oligosphaeraceae bacterium]